jgi:hypothetical protein
LELENGFLWIGLIEIFSHFIQGCTGFGATVIASSVVVSKLGAVDAIPFGTLVSMPALYVMGIAGFKNVSWKDVIKIVVACIPGVLVGRYLSQYLNPLITKLGIGMVITFVAVTNLYKTFFKKNTEDGKNTIWSSCCRAAALVVGAVIQGALVMGGPFITIYALKSVKEKERFCNTMNWVWILINTIFVIPGQYYSGAWTPRV